MKLNWFLIVPMVVLAAFGFYLLISADSVVSKVIGGAMVITACATVIAHIFEKMRGRVKDNSEDET